MYLFISLVLFKALPISKYRFPPRQTCKVLYPTITRELFINYVTVFKGGGGGGGSNLFINGIRYSKIPKI